MKQGHVRQRHTRNCPRDEFGGWLPHRCRGTWEYTVDLRRTGDGARRQVTKAGFATKRDALQALQRFLDDMRGGVDVESRALVGDYLDEWLESKRSLKPSTLNSYHQHVRLYLKPMLGHIPLRELRPRQIDVMLSEIARPKRQASRSPATVRRIHSTLRVALNDAVRRRLLTHNPAQYIELPRERRPPATVWTPEQVTAFLDSIRHDRLYALFHLVIVTGMRRGEVVALRWNDVDLEGGVLRITRSAVEFGSQIHVGAPKTRSGTRAVPLDALTVEVLRTHRERQQAERAQWGRGYCDTGIVFAREDGTMLRPEFVSRRFRDLSKRAGLTMIRFHDLRHTSASLALAAGVALKVVSERLGHSTIGITADLYTHVVPIVARDAADAIASVLAGSRDTSPADGWRNVGAERPATPTTDIEQKGA